MTQLWFKAALLSGGWARDVRLTLTDGTIVRIDCDVAPTADDARHGIALPGLANVHSHAFQRAMAGLTERRGPAEDNFWTWREIMYRFVDRLEPDDVQAIAAQADMEMLESGFTRVGEFHYLHHDPAGRAYASIAEMAARIVAAADETGIGLTLLPVFYAHSGFGGAPPNPGQRRFVTSLDLYARLLEDSRRAVARLPGATVGLAPHSLRAVTPVELERLVPLGGGAPIHIHVAEQTKEVEDCIAATGARPVEWLLDHAPVDERWCLVHATHTTEAELGDIAARRAVVGLCPISEANLGDGIFDARGFLAKGGRFGVGTDSNVLIDGAEELRVLEYGQRLVHRARNVLAGGKAASTGRTLFQGALAGGTAALGASGGELAEGAAADIVGLDANAAALVESDGDGVLDRWIFAARGQIVDSVWRAGRQVVNGGRHVARRAIATRFRRTMARLV